MATEISEQVYEDKRESDSMAPFHEWARTRDSGWSYIVVRIIFTPIVLLLYRARQSGKEKIPNEGPVIIAPNHFSNMDHFFCGVFIRRRIRFMAKSQFFGANPFLSWLFKNAGHFPVRRGAKDEEAFITGHSILERDGCVGIYAEGGRSRTGALGKPRAGVGRLAIESGAPVVPVAIHGSLAVRGWKRGRFPKIRVSYGEPIRFERNATPAKAEAHTASEQIFASVRAMYEAADAAGARR